MDDRATQAREQPALIDLPDGDSPGGTGLSLEGLWSDGQRGGAVIAPPHPLYGGSLDFPVVVEVARACRRVGLSSLRFNWRGVGASSGVPSGDEVSADADYDAAVAFSQVRSPGPVVGCGYSFGGAAAVRAAKRSSQLNRLVLVAPPMPLLDRAALQRFEHPVLVVVGDCDEYAPLTEVQSLVAEVKRAELVTLENTDHFFMTGGLSDLGPRVEEWLRRSLDPDPARA